MSNLGHRWIEIYLARSLSLSFTHIQTLYIAFVIIALSFFYFFVVFQLMVQLEFMTMSANETKSMLQHSKSESEAMRERNTQV